MVAFVEALMAYVGCFNTAICEYDGAVTIVKEIDPPVMMVFPEIVAVVAAKFPA
jgi:hypothetical protein